MGGYPWGTFAKSMSDWKDLEVYDIAESSWTIRKTYGEFKFWL